MSESTNQNQSNHWQPLTTDGRRIQVNDRLYWQALNGALAGRKVTVFALDDDERLVIVKDSTDTHHMAIPEELSSTN